MSSSVMESRDADIVNEEVKKFTEARTYEEVIQDYKEIIQGKEFEIDRLKDEKDGFYQENERLKKEIEDLKRKNEILEEEVKRLQDNEVSLSDKLDAVLKHNSSFSKRMKKKDNILKIIKGLVYSIANLLEV